MDDPEIVAYLETLDPSFAGDTLSGQLADRTVDPGDPDLKTGSELPADEQAIIDACLLCDLPDCDQSNEPKTCRLAYVQRGVNPADVPPAGALDRHTGRRVLTPCLLSAIDSLAAQERRATVRAVAHTLDVPVHAAYAAICRAIDEGLLTSAARGRKSSGSQLTPAGRARLAYDR